MTARPIRLMSPLEQMGGEALPKNEKPTHVGADMVTDDVGANVTSPEFTEASAKRDFFFIIFHNL